jgi:hypothetical protein
VYLERKPSLLYTMKICRHYMNNFPPVYNKKAACYLNLAANLRPTPIEVSAYTLREEGVHTRREGHAPRER